MDTTGSLFLPPSSSTISPEVDALLSFLFYAALFFLAVVSFSLIFFLFKYRRRGQILQPSTGPTHNLALEIIWTVVPLALVLFLFVWGFRVYMRMSVVPKDALEIKVTGQKWFWSFAYPDGATSVNELVVPAGKPIKLLMSSTDVIHSFFVPDFRLKRDVLPNRYTILWFEAPREGSHRLTCAEYCGTKHSLMTGTVRVVNDRQYAEWLQAGSQAGAGLSPLEFGAKLYADRECETCHSTDGTPGNGPSFLGVYGHRVTFADGTSLETDENYLRESILLPQKKVVAGYQPIMPTYQSLLKPAEVDALIAYIKSLAGNPP